MGVHYRRDSTVITSQADSGQYLVKLRHHKFGGSSSCSSSSSGGNIPDSFVGGVQFKHSPSYAGHNVTGLTVVWVSPNEHRDRKFRLWQIEILPTKFYFLLSSNDSKILVLLKKNRKIDYEWISYGIWLQSNKPVRKITIKHAHNGPVFNVQSTTTYLPVWKARRYFEYVWGVVSLYWDQLASVQNCTRNWQQAWNCSLLWQDMRDDEWTKV